jgi:hypothetical protein
MKMPDVKVGFVGVCTNLQGMRMGSVLSISVYYGKVNELERM